MLQYTYISVTTVCIIIFIMIAESEHDQEENLEEKILAAVESVLERFEG